MQPVWHRDAVISLASPFTDGPADRRVPPTCASS